MKRILLISILSFGLVWSWSIACAEDGFYVIPVKNRNYADQRTGVTECRDPYIGEIACSGTGQDGEYQKGVAWPNPRFTDNGDGTVKDNLTGLIWLKNTNCSYFFNGDSTWKNGRSWSNALTAANSLADSYCGLTDGSNAGDWRLPNVRELQSVIHYGWTRPALSNTAGTGRWTEGDPFAGVGVQFNDYYWSSTPLQRSNAAWSVNFYRVYVEYFDMEDVMLVWPVRGGN